MKAIIIAGIIFVFVVLAYSLPTPPQYLQLCDNTCEGGMGESWPEHTTILIEVIMPPQYTFAEYVGVYIGPSPWGGWYVIYNAERQLIWRREGGGIKQGWLDYYAGKYIPSGKIFYVGVEFNYTRGGFGIDTDPPHHYYKNWIIGGGWPMYDKWWHYFVTSEPMIRVQVAGSPAVYGTSLGRTKSFYR